MRFNEVEEQSFVEEILKDKTLIHLRKGDYLYHVGDSPKGLYFIKEGLVGLIRTTAKGQESLLRLFKKGQFLGHRSLFSDEHYHASARCLEDTHIIFAPKEEVLQRFDDNPRAYYFLARALAKELRRAEVRSVLVSEGDVMERVVSTLLLFKSLYPDHLWTRTEIANFCASRTPTVIKALGELEAQGLIRQQGRKIEILNYSKMLELID